MSEAWQHAPQYTDSLDAVWAALRSLNSDYNRYRLYLYENGADETVATIIDMKADMLTPDWSEIDNCDVQHAAARALDVLTAALEQAKERGEFNNPIAKARGLQLWRASSPKHTPRMAG